MAQNHDYNKPTSGVTRFKELYVALRENFEAVRSCHAGTATPTQPAHGMLWVDQSTTPNRLKFYNSATSQWEGVSNLLVEATTGAGPTVDIALASLDGRVSTLEGSPYTDARAVVAIKEADGAGSGLDADQLDGYHAGNASGNIPVNNGTLNTNLNANLLDGQRGSWYVPPGAVMAFARSTAPTGWLECNGVAVSRTTHANLFAAIGTTFGAGDGSTTFNLPDLRGEFVRGWDHNRGVDSGRAFGNCQADEVKAHSHSYTEHIPGTTWWAGDWGDTGHTAHMDTTQTGNTGSAGGSETRPRNVALMYCIKL